jgi:hypothetical protein
MRNCGQSCLRGAHHTDKSEEFRNIYGVSQTKRHMNTRTITSFSTTLSKTVAIQSDSFVSIILQPKSTKLTVMVKSTSIEFLRVMNLNSEPYNSFLYSYKINVKMSFLTFKCQSKISGSLSPRHGASSGCGWSNGLQYGG